MFIGYIYKITGSCGRVYIGSTVRPKKRFTNHSANSKKKECLSRILEKPLIFTIIRQDEYKLFKTMRLVEQYYLDNNNCVNKKRAYGWKKIDIEEKRQYFREKTRVYNKTPKGIKTRKEYLQNNREKINEKLREKKECKYCKALISKGCMSRHHKTKRCLAIQKSLNLS